MAPALHTLAGVTIPPLEHPELDALAVTELERLGNVPPPAARMPRYRRWELKAGWELTLVVVPVTGLQPLTCWALWPPGMATCSRPLKLETDEQIRACLAQAPQPRRRAGRRTKA